MNGNPIERIKVPANCKGMISINSTWLYHQELDRKAYKDQKVTEFITNHVRIYTIEFPFQVNEAGEIQIFKGTVRKEKDHIKDEANLFFYLDELEVDVQENNLLSLSGGVRENDNSIIPDSLRYYGPSTRTHQAEMKLSFSLMLELEKGKNQKIVTPKVQELVFEKENQAVLSSDQLRVLQKWWDSLNVELKESIKRQEAYIEIIGYTTTTGTDLYNHKLGKERAIDVRDLLIEIIGVNTDNKSIAIINCSTKGELSDNPSRYVKIIIKN